MAIKPFPVDLTRLLAPHRGEWVALSQDEMRILGHGDTIEAALSMAKGKEAGRPLLIKVPDDEGAGFALI